MPELQRLREQVQQAIESATRHGAQGVWATLYRSRSVETEMRNARLERVQENISRGLSLRLFVDGRYSTHGTSDLANDRLDSFIREAVALSRALEPDPHRQLADPALYNNRPQDLGLIDARIRGIDHDKRTQWCTEMHDQLANRERVISGTTSVYDDDSMIAAASSNGFSGAWAATSVGMYAEVTLKDEGDKRPEAGMGATAHSIDGLMDAKAIGESAYKRAQDRLGSKKGPSLRTTLVVDPMVSSRLIAALLSPSSGGLIQQGRSFWANKTGQLLTTPKLSIKDDPLIPGGLGSRPFDSEGISAKPMQLLEKGVIRNFFLDTYYASKLKLKPTTGSSSNIIVELGSGNLKHHVANAGEGVLVTSWLGGNSDSTTGNFSFGIRGHMIRNGKIAEPVSEMNVTDNLPDLFSRLVAIGDDPWPYSTKRVPTLVFENVQFSGS